MKKIYPDIEKNRRMYSLLCSSMSSESSSSVKPSSSTIPYEPAEDPSSRSEYWEEPVSSVYSSCVSSSDSGGDWERLTLGARERLYSAVAGSLEEGARERDSHVRGVDRRICDGVVNAPPGAGSRGVVTARFGVVVHDSWRKGIDPRHKGYEEGVKSVCRLGTDIE